MNGDVLGAALKAAVDAVADKTDRDALFKAMGDAIVLHIQTNAAVTVTSVSGVTIGTGVSGPGAGTVG